MLTPSVFAIAWSAHSGGRNLNITRTVDKQNDNISIIEEQNILSFGIGRYGSADRVWELSELKSPRRMVRYRYVATVSEYSLSLPHSFLHSSSMSYPANMTSFCWNYLVLTNPNDSLQTKLVWHLELFLSHSSSISRCPFQTLHSSFSVRGHRVLRGFFLPLVRASSYYAS